MSNQRRADFYFYFYNCSTRWWWILQICPDLLRDPEADVGTQSEHVLHLLRCGGDQRDVQGEVALLQVLQVVVKLGLTGMSDTCPGKGHTLQQ